MSTEQENTQVEVQNAEKVVAEAPENEGKAEGTEEAHEENEPTDSAADEEPMDTGRLHE